MRVKQLLMSGISLWFSIVSAGASVGCDTVPRSVQAAVGTNLLYDAALVPNVGVSLSWPGGWTSSAALTGAWWSDRSRDRVWRIYGIEAAVGHRFGPAAARSAFAGHRAGIYAQVLTFDFQFGDRGYLGGRPGGNLFERPVFGAGVEYGYTLPLGRRLAVDFSVGVGWLGGEYDEYERRDGHYVWLRTHRFDWIGPTRAAVTLVWRLGDKAGGGI